MRGRRRKIKKVTSFSLRRRQNGHVQRGSLRVWLGPGDEGNTFFCNVG
jgi:hypothetical protein